MLSLYALMWVAMPSSGVGATEGGNPRLTDIQNQKARHRAARYRLAESV
jgi:hypothetical protein